MDYCGPRGIPHSAFLSWDIDDQAKALGWMAEQSQRCSGCGTAKWEWEADLNAYEAHSEVCPGCHALGVEAKEQKHISEQVPGLKIFLRKPDLVEV